MHKANELFGKDVVDQTTGERIGQVQKLVFDAQTCKLVALLETSGTLFGGTRVVRWERVVSLGDVVVAVFDGEPPKLRDDPEVSDLRERGAGSPARRSSPRAARRSGRSPTCCSTTGVVPGYEVKRGLVRALVGDRDRVPVEDVISFGKDAIIVRDRPPDAPESAGRR